MQNEKKKTGSIEEQEFFGEVLLSIKQVIQNHLHDVQVRFLDQFNAMQNEIKNRDLVINELHMRINELEGGANINLMNSPIEETRMSGSGSSGDIAFVVCIFHYNNFSVLSILIGNFSFFSDFFFFFFLCLNSEAIHSIQYLQHHHH